MVKGVYRTGGTELNQRFFLYENHFFDLIKLMFVLYVEHHPFAVVISVRRVINRMDKRGKFVFAPFKRGALLRPEDNHQTHAVFFGKH